MQIMDESVNTSPQTTVDSLLMPSHAAKSPRHNEASVVQKY